MLKMEGHPSHIQERISSHEKADDASIRAEAAEGWIADLQKDISDFQRDVFSCVPSVVLHAGTHAKHLERAIEERTRMKETTVQRYHMKASALKVEHAMTSWV